MSDRIFICGTPDLRRIYGLDRRTILGLPNAERGKIEQGNNNLLEDGSDD